MVKRFNIEINNNYLKLREDKTGVYQLSSNTFEKISRLKIDKGYLPFLSALNYLDPIFLKGEKVFIGIDGMSNSYKTSFITFLKTLYSFNNIHTDNYFKIPPFNPKETGLSYGNNINYPVIINEVITPLLSSEKEIAYPIFKNHSDKPTYIKTSNYPITIIEGAYSLNTPLINYYNYKILFKTESENQLNRLKNRESSEKVNTFITKWIPLENKYLKWLEKNTDFDLIIKT